MKEFFESLLEIPQNIYYDIKSFVQATRRFFYWGWKLRYSYEFDSHGLYEMISLKLRSCHKYFSTKGHCVWNSSQSNKDMRRILVAANLAERLYGDGHDYLTRAHKEHEKKWGKAEHIWKPTGKGMSMMQIKYPNVHTKQDEINCTKDFRRIMSKYNTIRHNDKKLLFKLLEHNLEQWWD